MQSFSLSQASVGLHGTRYTAYQTPKQNVLLRAFVGHCSKNEVLLDFLEVHVFTNSSKCSTEVRSWRRNVPHPAALSSDPIAVCCLIPLWSLRLRHRWA